MNLRLRHTEQWRFGVFWQDGGDGEGPGGVGATSGVGGSGGTSSTDTGGDTAPAGAGSLGPGGSLGPANFGLGTTTSGGVTQGPGDPGVVGVVGAPSAGAGTSTSGGFGGSGSGAAGGGTASVGGGGHGAAPTGIATAGPTTAEHQAALNQLFGQQGVSQVTNPLTQFGVAQATALNPGIQNALNQRLAALTGVGGPHGAASLSAPPTSQMTPLSPLTQIALQTAFGNTIGTPSDLYGKTPSGATEGVSGAPTTGTTLAPSPSPMAPPRAQPAPAARGSPSASPSAKAAVASHGAAGPVGPAPAAPASPALAAPPDVANVAPPAPPPSVIAPGVTAQPGGGFSRMLQDVLGISTASATTLPQLAQSAQPSQSELNAISSPMQMFDFISKRGGAITIPRGETFNLSPNLEGLPIMYAPNPDGSVTLSITPTS